MESKTLQERLNKYTEYEYPRGTHDVLDEHMNLPLVGYFTPKNK